MYRINEGNTGQGLPSEVIDAFLKGFEIVDQYWIWTEPYYKSDSFELECDDLSAYDVAFLGATTGSDYLDEHIISAAEEEEKYLRNLYEGDEIDEERFDDYLAENLGRVKYTITLQPDNDGVFITLEVYYGENTWDTLYQEDFYLRDVDEVETAGADIANKMNWISSKNV